MNDYGRYKRIRQSPQVANVPSMLQPIRTIAETPKIHSDNVVQQTSKDTGSKSEAEIWSFDRVINEVFRLLRQESCPKLSEKQTPAKPLSGIEHLMELRTTPLLVLVLSKLVENTTKFIQDKIDSENFGRRGRQHSFVEIDHEIFSMVILSLPLIQEGQLSVSGERMCTILVNRLED